MTRDETLAVLKAALPELRVRYGVVRIGLFGSVARNEAGPDSDVDLVAEFAPDAKIGMFKLFDLERELTQRLGRPAVISAISQMNPYVRSSVERDLVYVRTNSEIASIDRLSGSAARGGREALCPSAASC